MPDFVSAYATLVPPRLSRARLDAAARRIAAIHIQAGQQVAAGQFWPKFGVLTRNLSLKY